MLAIGGIVVIFVLMLSLIGVIVASVYVYKDAKKRNMNSLGWMLLTLFIPFFLGLIIYLVCRNPLVDFQCPSCGTGLPKYARECPNCGHSMLTQCPTCEFPVQRGWKTCPKCGNTLPESYEQPVKTYRKDNSGFIVMIVVIGLVLAALISVLSTFGLINSGDFHNSEGYAGMEGLYNITEDDFAENETITEWLEDCKKSNKSVYVLLSKDSETCLVYVKDNEHLISSTIDLTYYDDQECDVTIFIDETQYENSYGYHFFLYEFEQFEDTDVNVLLNGEEVSVEVNTTDADISIDTWGGMTNEIE